MSSPLSAISGSSDPETKAILQRLDEISKIQGAQREAITKASGQSQLEEITKYNNLTSEQTALITRLNGLRSGTPVGSITPTTAIRSTTPSKSVLFVNTPTFGQTSAPKTFIAGPMGSAAPVYLAPQAMAPTLSTSITLPSGPVKASLPLTGAPKAFEGPRMAPFKSSVGGLSSSFAGEGLKSSVVMLEKPTHGEHVIKIRPKDVLRIAERPQTASLKTSLYDPILNNEIATGNGAVTYKLIKNPLEADRSAHQITPDLEYGKFDSGQNIGGGVGPQVVYVAETESYSAQQIGNLQPFWNGQKLEPERSEEEALREMVQTLAWRITPGVMGEKLRELCPMCHSIAKLFPDFRPNCSAVSEWAFANLEEAFRFIKLSYGGQLPESLLQREAEFKSPGNPNPALSDNVASRVYMAQARQGEPMAQGEIQIKNVPGGIREVGEHEHISSKKHLVIMDAQDEFDDDCEACKEERAMLEKLGKLPPKKQAPEPPSAPV